MKPFGLRVVIVADDLTGAMDAAAPFARRGLDVRVLTSPEALQPALAELPQVLSINTGTRHATAETASAVVTALIGALAHLKPDLFIKKIDSTLRGHVVVETVAALQATNYGEVLICPAIPAQGRTLSGGELFINKVPLRATAIGLDLRSPPPLVPLPELFRTALPNIPVTLEGPYDSQDKISESSSQHIRIADAATTEQLQLLARAAIDRCDDILFVGAGGLTEALADELFGSEVAVAATPALPGASLFVVGSRAPQVVEQVEALKAAHPLTVISELTAENSLSTAELQHLAAAGPRHAILVIRAPQATGNRGYDSDLVAGALAVSAFELLSQAEVGLLLATGGDTVLAVLDVLGVNVIRVCGEVRPGIVHGLIRSPKGPLRLVTKAGGFGDEQIFCTVIEYFR